MLPSQRNWLLYSLLRNGVKVKVLFNFGQGKDTDPIPALPFFDLKVQSVASQSGEGSGYRLVRRVGATTALSAGWERLPPCPPGGSGYRLVRRVGVATALSAESMRQKSAVGISSFFIYISHSSFLISHLGMPHFSFKTASFLISHLD